MIKYEINHEKLNIEMDEEKQLESVLLSPLTSQQKEIINPLVPPTSGIRMVILDEDKLNSGQYFMPKYRQEMFLRVFKAVSEIGKKELRKEHPGVLLVSDDRPTANYLLGYCAKILAFDGYKLYFQKATDLVSKQEAEHEPFYSRMGTPHGSASLALFDELDLVIVLTASHNELIWNGIKFYINVPMPISGKVMHAVSEKAIELNSIPLSNDFSAQYIDANKRNNDYIINLTKQILDLNILKGNKIVLWPYMGRAPEIQDLFKQVGVDVILVEEQMEPPNPTVNIDHEKIEKIMKSTNASISILLDTDRDRLVFIVRNPKTGNFDTLMPNTLYAAMHQLLATEYSKKIINVRTIPSDPRGDDACAMTFVTGVGYKHLGVILYGALGEKIEPVKLQSSILYFETLNGFQKVSSVENIYQIISESNLRGENIVLALWEESGGHTFNLLNIQEEKGNIKISSSIPSIGDKYPGEALLVLTTLIFRGFNLSQVLNSSIIGTRAMIDADDKKKLKIIEIFTKLQGKTFNVNEKIFTVGTFDQIQGKVAIIHLYTSDTNVYFRPSGTGPGVRIYIFGPKMTIEQDLLDLKENINKLFFPK
ncbi:MAG: hypothetical protein ACTSVU_04705 [Promethearchaeota archaeon]